MPSPYDIEQIENWASEFAETPAFSQLAPGDREAGTQVAAEFLRHACASEKVGPGEVGEAGARAALLEHLPTLGFPDDVRPRIPEIVALFLEALQAQGRLGGSLPSFVRVLAPAFRERCAAGGGLRVPPARNAAPSLGRNDPCPCGSGKKYKKCCGK